MKKTYEANIFVQFVPKEVTEDQFRDEMTKCGKVISVKLKEFMQLNKGTGETFVNF
jgi:RNA recognition motif-containing protein